jgi:hypothetical protein
MKKIKQYKKLIIVVLVIILAGFYFSYYNVQGKKNDIESQSKCSVMAEKYFNKNYTDSNGDTVETYINHFNSKLNKCFILAQSYNIKEDFLMIDLYDALENKHYGAFIGHDFCDKSSLQLSNDLNKCTSDVGVIWFNGDDTISPDFKTKDIGDENTKKEFMDKIKPFMND